MKRILTAAALAATLLTAQATAAQADGHDLVYCAFSTSVCEGKGAVVTPYPAAKKYVTVRKGDTLWRIAVREYGHQYAYAEKGGHHWKTIAKMNGITGTKIRAGQTLRVR